MIEKALAAYEKALIKRKETFTQEAKKHASQAQAALESINSSNI